MRLLIAEVLLRSPGWANVGVKLNADGKIQPRKKGMGGSARPWKLIRTIVKSIFSGTRLLVGMRRAGGGSNWCIFSFGRLEYLHARI